MERGGFFSSISGYGYNEIVIESPDHGAKFENMSIEQLNGWLDVLIEREQQLYLRKYIKYVQIFRNYGVDAGASIGHPHTQIMAWPIVIGNIKRRLRIAVDYKSKNNSCLYEDAVKKETARNLYSNSTFDAVAPFASRITAESLIIPKRHINSMIEMTQEEKTGLSDMLKRIVSVNKLLFGAQSYNILFYELKDQPDFHMHVEVLPRLSTLAGVELGQNVFVNTVVPEQYAAEFKSKLSGA
jgi:UDPglucose--hexose-1-phosphate uridylyltransferase